MEQHNPYAAPTEPPDAAAQPARGLDVPPQLMLAGWVARLVGAFIDGVFAWGLRLGAMWFTFTRMFHPETLPPEDAFAQLTRLLVATLLGSWLLSDAVQAFLVAHRGQSIGKIVTRTRIVRADGSPAGLFRGFVVRTLPFSALPLLPMGLQILRLEVGLQELVYGLWPFAFLIDAALIFGATRRCGHDRLAGTLVVKADHSG